MIFVFPVVALHAFMMRKSAGLSEEAPKAYKILLARIKLMIFLSKDNRVGGWFQVTIFSR